MSSLNGTTVVFYNVGSGTVLDLTASGPDNGTPIIGYQYHGGQNQQWKLLLVSSSGEWPVWKIQNVATGTFIDLYNGGTDNGTAISGWAGNPSDTSNPHQLWRFVTADPSGQISRLQNVGSSTYVDLYNGSSDNGTKVTGWAGQVLEWNTHQIWQIKQV